MRPIVIAAGGTGGHFFPAEALAAVLVDRGHRVVLMTDRRSGALGSPVFAGRECHVLAGAGLAGRGARRAATAMVLLATGTLQARRILAGLEASVIVGFGGYPSVPPVLAARLLRRRPRLLLHEQNAVLGRANRFLARRADLLAVGFADTAGVPAGVGLRITGNPVRPAIQALRGVPFAFRDQRIELLVLGGSLGARVFSDVVPDAVMALPDELRARLHVVQQCRAEDITRVREAYARAQVHAETAPFFANVSELLQSAHLVVSRAGASTCAEITVVGRPAILVPLPGAIDDHQAANARALTGASVIRQTDFTPERLTRELVELLCSPGRLAAAAQLAAGVAHADAAGSLADLVEQMAVDMEPIR